MSKSQPLPLQNCHTKALDGLGGRVQAVWLLDADTMYIIVQFNADYQFLRKSWKKIAQQAPKTATQAHGLQPVGFALKSFSAGGVWWVQVNLEGVTSDENDPT